MQRRRPPGRKLLYSVRSARTSPDRARRRGELLLTHRPSADRSRKLGLTRSDRAIAVFVGTNPNDVFEVGDENLAVADFAGVRLELDCVDHRLVLLILDHQLNFQLGQKVDHVFRATVQFGVTLLTTESFHFVNRHDGDTETLKLLFYRIQSERLDDSFDF